MSRERMGRTKRFLYRFCRLVCRTLSMVAFRIEIDGSENFPKEGSFIAAPGGHRSYLDTPIMTLVSNRVLRFIGAAEFFHKPVLGPFLDLMGGFPVDRGVSDREALATAEGVVAAGEPLVMFPEGARFVGPTLENLKLGVAFIACRQQVPVVPVGLGGLERVMGKGHKFIKPYKVVIVIGEPIYPPAQENGRVKRSKVVEFSELIQTELQKTYDEAEARAT